MGFNIGPRVVRATGGSIKRVGNYRIHTFPSQYVTDGLVHHVDAGHPKSMRAGNTSNSGGTQSNGGGRLSSWNDLSGNGTNCAFSGTVDRTIGYGGAMTFAGAGAAQAGNLGTVLKAWTVEVWFKSSEVSNYHNVCDMNYGTGHSNMGPRLEQATGGGCNWYMATKANTSSYVQMNASGTDGGGNIDTTKYHHMVLTMDGNSMVCKSYQNGALIATQTGMSYLGLHGAPDTFEQVTWGLGFSASRYFKGDIAIGRVYNRALSTDEVKQNYDAEKVRFMTGYTIDARYTNTFTPTCAGNKGKVEVLVVGGGGGAGGYAGGGGGGAGGLLYDSNYSVTNNVGIAISVGAGGTGGDKTLSNTYVDNFSATQGGTSKFGTLVSIGGGWGRAWSQGGATNAYAGNIAGGSGGGWLEVTSSTTTPNNSGGNFIAGQGHKGGGSNKPSTNEECGGGGGGAGGHGNGNGSNAGIGATITTGVNSGFTTSTATGAVVGANYAGAGGPGLKYDISGEPKWYAGGGGGSAYSSAEGRALGGSGVGGDGGFQGGNINATGGMPNTGSGGGGGGRLYSWGENGSNGIVIVRYPAVDYNIELLMVAGGGGGGNSGGGGGAGGFLYYPSLAVTSGKNYIINVGAGGTGGLEGSAVTGGSTRHGYNGADTTFGDIVAIGGGGGGSGRNNSLPQNGGSGGGGGRDSGVSGGGNLGTVGRGTSGQGHDGGSSWDDGASSAGGGGGAGGAGGHGRDGDTAVSHATGGAGGPGLQSSISGTLSSYAGGGAGGSYNRTPQPGRDGGGTGAGNNDTDGTNGTANTGGGGGGGGGTNTGSDPNGTGGNGGSGILIVAYKGPQRGEGGVISNTARPGYTTHTYTLVGPHRFIA